jgi:hypothetical protein
MLPSNCMSHSNFTLESLMHSFSGECVQTSKRTFIVCPADQLPRNIIMPDSTYKKVSSLIHLRPFFIVLAQSKSMRSTCVVIGTPEMIDEGIRKVGSIKCRGEGIGTLVLSREVVSIIGGGKLEVAKSVVQSPGGYCQPRPTSPHEDGEPHSQ